jgi:hypothetical protein
MDIEIGDAGKLTIIAEDINRNDAGGTVIAETPT